MWIGKGNPVLVHSEEMSYVDLHQGIFHFTQEQWAAQMESVKSLFPRFSCSLWHPSHRSKNWVSITKKRHRNQKINTPALCCLSASPKSSSQDMGLCGHTHWSVLGDFSSLLKVSQTGEITGTCRPGGAHPSPVRHNAGFEYSLAIVALYPAVIPSFPLLPLINNWRYWLPSFPPVQHPQ